MQSHRGNYLPLITVASFYLLPCPLLQYECASIWGVGGPQKAGGEINPNIPYSCNKGSQKGAPTFRKLTSIGSRYKRHVERFRCQPIVDINLPLIIIQPCNPLKIFKNILYNSILYYTIVGVFNRFFWGGRHWKIL